MKKDDNIKEQFKQALISTIKVISDEYKNDPKANPNLSSKNFNFFELDNLNNKYDLIVYGLLDSHSSLSGKGGIRLDSYVYTVEALKESKKI